MSDSVYLLSFNDAHCADRAPESRMDEDYLGTILSKMDQIVKVANKLKAPAILNAGDLFHIKTASRNSHAMVQRLIKVFTSTSAKVLSIAGNHDITMDRLDTLSKQPLGDLFLAGIMENVHLNPVQVSGGDAPKVKVVGLGFTNNMSEYAGAVEFQKAGYDYVVGLFHCNAVPRGGRFFDEQMYSYKQLKEMFPDVDVFVLGHLHFYTGIHQMHGSWFINIGALSRASVHLDNLQRKVMAGLIKFTKEGIECKGLELRVLPAEEVLSVEKHEAKKEEKRRIDEFIRTLAAEGAESGSDAAVRSYLDGVEIPIAVRDKAFELLEAAGLEDE